MTGVMGDKPPTTVKELAKALSDFSARIDAKHDELKKDITKVIEGELQTLRQSINFMNEQFEQFRVELGETKKELAAVRAENHAIKSENSRLVKNIKEIKQELTAQQQYSRQNNLEIKGVPVMEGENLVSTMQQLASYLKVEIKETDIDVVHRVPSRNASTPNIIVRFLSRAVKDNVLKTAKKQRLNTTALGFQGIASPVYINEHLCPANKELLTAALKTKREKNWKYTWVTGGKILMRKADNSRVLHVTCAEDLSKVV